MARMHSLKDRVRQIIRRYKKINGHKFVYNKRSDLQARYFRIQVWFLIHDADKGYSIFPFIFRRKVAFSVPQWTRLFKTPLGDYNALFSIFTQAILPAINNKGGNNWTYKALLAWTGIHDLRPAEDSNTSRRRNKTVKKRDANARHRGRRRQRD